VLAEVGERQATDEFACRLREHDLASVRRRADSRREVHVVSDVPLVCQEGRSGVQPDAQVDAARSERVGDRLRRSHRSRCVGEREEERVPLRVDLDSAMRCGRVTNDAAMLSHGEGVGLCAKLVQELRRALHIGEEEGDGAGREIVSQSPDHPPGPIRRLVPCRPRRDHASGRIRDRLAQERSEWTET
jgi:hypothetical protein